MARPTPEPPRYASPPFDDPTGDFILRSSDRVDFRVFRVILRLASSVFASMLEIGQAPPAASDASQTGSDEFRDGCPVVPLQEDSDTLDYLLRMVYPTRDPDLGDLSKLSSVIAVALKYEMEQVVALGSTTLLRFVPKDPFSVWALTVRNGLEDQARTAADEINRQQISVLDSFPPELRDVTAGQYYRLLQYRRLGGAVGEGFKFCHPPLSLARPSPLPSPTATTDSTQNLADSLVDIVCRSSDGQEFPAHRILLALASPVIATLMTRLPEQHNAGGEATDSTSTPATALTRLPVLHLDEDGATLRILICLCQPSRPASTEWQDLVTLPSTVVDAVKKYEMTAVMVSLQVRWPLLAAVDPLRAYLVAANCKSSAQAREAALRLLDRTVEDYYVQELEYSPASVYRSVLLHHRDCKGAACGVAWLIRSFDDNLPVPQKSHCCSEDDRHARLYGCFGVELRGVFSGEDFPSCNSCVLLRHSILRTCEVLESPSGALYATMESLKNPSHSSNLICIPSSNEQDRSAILTLYQKLYHKLADKVNQACVDHIDALAQT
ncbi:hypothetical protein EVJ58_g5001 [Rhodofomes roseus]|uniref:BTB domain-containing protein n=1 Tax=Rhodofomes roseus TaxID=34475 RepID=A0A4Y9YEA3_9APHY|nr:hypothetical protein EVJ58_g5001 [Rhodofomes roseus]